MPEGVDLVLGHRPVPEPSRWTWSWVIGPAADPLLGARMASAWVCVFRFQAFLLAVARVSPSQQGEEGLKNGGGRPGGGGGGGGFPGGGDPFDMFNM